MGVSIHSEELKWILYRLVFAHVMWIGITQIRACCLLWRTLIALSLVRKRWTRYQNAWKKYGWYDRENLAFLCCKMSVRAITRGNAQKISALAQNFENAYNGLKRVQKKFGTNLSILKFWCARTCASRCARKICWHF